MKKQQEKLHLLQFSFTLLIIIVKGYIECVAEKGGANHMCVKRATPPNTCA